MLSRPGQRSFHEERRQIDAAGNAVVARPQIIQTGGVAGPIVARGDLVEERTRLLIAGQNVVRGDEMIVLAMRHRANDGVLVGARGETRQMLGHQQSRRLRRGRLELAAQLRRRVGFEIKRIEMAGRPREEDNDDGLPFSRGLRRFGRGALGLLRSREGKLIPSRPV